MASNCEGSEKLLTTMELCLYNLELQSYLGGLKYRLKYRQCKKKSAINLSIETNKQKVVQNSFTVQIDIL